MMEYIYIYIYVYVETIYETENKLYKDIYIKKVNQKGIL